MYETNTFENFRDILDKFNFIFIDKSTITCPFFRQFLNIINTCVYDHEHRRDNKYFFNEIYILKLNIVNVEPGAKHNELNKPKESLSRRLCFEQNKFAIKF